MHRRNFGRNRENILLRLPLAWLTDRQPLSITVEKYSYGIFPASFFPLEWCALQFLPRILCSCSHCSQAQLNKSIEHIKKDLCAAARAEAKKKTKERSWRLANFTRNEDSSFGIGKLSISIGNFQVGHVVRMPTICDTNSAYLSH
jgi:hypothetical protein